MTRFFSEDPFLMDTVPSTDIAPIIVRSIIEHINPPYSISLDGTWGSGKTTLLRNLEEILKQNSYPTLWFNPWEYSRTNDVVLAFLQQISLAFKKKFQLQDLGIFSLSLFSSGIDVAARILSGGALSYENVSKIVEDSNEALKKEYETFVNFVEDIKKDFAKLTLKVSKNHNNKPLIVFMDDLDRCLPEEAIHLLEALKNLFIVKNAKVIFVCAIDTSIAKRFIAERYKGISEDFSINYFKKVFNLTISIPQSDSVKLRKTITLHLDNFFNTTDILGVENKSIAEQLCRLIELAGINSYRDISNIVKNLYMLYSWIKDKPNRDAALGLLVLKEKWYSLYENLKSEARKDSTGTFAIMLSRSSFVPFFKDERLKGFIQNEIPKDILVSEMISTGLL